MRSKTLMVGLACMALAALAFSISGRSQKPEEQQDSAQMKLLWERVKVEVTTDEDYEYLQQLGIDCPQRGECEVIINRWQTKQLEKRGLKVTRLQRLCPDEGPNQVEYELVKEFDLTDDGVGTVVFGPKNDKSSALSEIILGLKDKEVLVYDSDFKLLQKLSLHHPTFSKNLRYIGGIRYEKLPRIYEDSLPPHRTIHEKGSYKFELYDYMGSKRWELERELYYDASPNSYSISSQGAVVERDHLNGFIAFYDKNGNEMKRVQLYVGTWDPGGQGIRSEFSEDGTYVLITAADDYSGTFGEGIGVFFFTSGGDEVWRFNTQDRGTGANRISSLDNYIALSSKGTTYLVSKEGSIQAKYDDLFSTNILFAKDEEHVVLIEHYHTAYLIDTRNGERCFKYSVFGRPRGIYAADIAGQDEMLGLISCYSALTTSPIEVQDKEKNIELLLVGFDRRKVWSRAFPWQEGPLFRTVNLSISDDGISMAVQIGSKIMIYRRAQ